MRMHVTIGVLALSALVLLAPRAHAQDSLEAARQLYASAEYDSALTMLNGLMVSTTTREDRRTIALYRTLCLLATNRRAEADRAIEALVTQDPLFRPSADDIPPRMRTAIAETRKRMLPGILHQKYAESKAAYDRSDFPVASVGFKEILDGLADPDIAAAAAQSPLADLKTLASGFYELTMKAMAPPPALPAPRVAELPPVPAPIVPRAPRIYTVDDRNVVPPIVVRQQIPPFPGRVTVAKLAVLEVLIDITGGVESATMRVSVSPQYDRMVTLATRSWQYQPATVDGTPVKFLKRIQVSLVPTP
jgi:hypothetical protein